MDCHDCDRLLFAFLDGELETEAAEGLQRHLDACAECFQRSQLEEALRRTIRQRAAERDVPAGLEDRIRSALDRADAQEELVEARRERDASRSRGRALLRWTLPFAAVVVLALLTHALVLAPRDGTSPLAERARMTPLQVRGTLVCLGCDMERRSALQPASRALLPLRTLRSALDDPHAHRRLHFRAEDGSFWELVASEPATEPVASHDNAGRAATLTVMDVLADLHVMHVARVQFED